MIYSPKTIIFFAFILFVIITQNLQSQVLVNDISDSEYNFFEIQRRVYEDWSKQDQNDIRGYKQFKRWEYFWYQRTFPNGEFPNGNNILESYKSSVNNKQDEPNFLNVKWKSLGPYNEPVDAGGSQGIGRVNAVRVNPINHNEIWAASASGGLWKSADGGKNWLTFEFTQFLSIGISDIGISFSNPKIVYASTGDMYGSTSSRNYYSIGLIKTTDGGLTWNVTNLNTKLEDRLILGRVLVHPSNPNLVYVASNKGLRRSTDGGNTWRIIEGNSHFIDLEFKPKDANTIYASTYGGGASVYVSTDNGETWDRTLAISNGIRIDLATTEANPNKIYALAANTSTYGFNSVHVSVESGKNWEKLSDATTTPNILGWYSGNWQSDSRGQGFYDLTIAASPDNENEIFVGGINIWKSTDGGKTFSKVSHWVPTKNGLPYIHADQHNLIFGPDKSTLFVCNDGGIDKTTNKGTTFTSLSQGLNIAQYYRLGVSQTNSNMTILGAQDNGTALIKFDNSWSKINGADGMEAIIDPVNPQIMYASIYNGSIYRSLNGGANFQTILTQNSTKEPGAWVTPYILNPQNSKSIYAGYTNVWKSDNSGAAGSWKPISKLSPSSSLQSLAIAPSDTNVIYAASVNQLFATYDGGVSWNTIYTSGNYITYIAVDFENPRRLWITKSGYTNDDKVLELIDSVVVRNISGNLPNVPVNTIVLQPNSPDRLYIGTDIGVYVSDYNSGYWERYGTDLPNVIISELEIQTTTNTLFASTYGRGLWTVPLICCNAPQPEIEIIGFEDFCVGDTVILRAKNEYPNYLWSTGETSKEIMITKSGSYSLFVGNGSGCFGRSEQFYIPSSPFEQISVAPTVGDYLCPDGNLTIIASPVGFSEYIWSNGDKTRETTVSEPGYYSVIGISPEGCVVESEPIYIDVMPAPEKPMITQEGRTLIAPYASAYQWYLDGRRILSSKSREHYIQDGKVGDYSVMVFNEFNCGTLSDNFSIITNVQNDIYSDFEISVANNPGNGNFLLKFSNPLAGNIKIVVSDINGKETITFKDYFDGFNSYSLDLTNLNSGVYLLTIFANNTAKVTKIIKY
ncbi:hypothetical protein MASR1M45_01730 [Candidatus Kapaibacterium sp.]